MELGRPHGKGSKRVNENKREYSEKALLEHLAFIGIVFAAIVVLALGAYLAWCLDDPHWMNRSGAAVVAIQAVAGLAEYARRRRLGRLERSTAPAREAHARTAGEHGTSLEEKKLHFLEEEVAKSEFQALAIVLSLAAVGEIVHGFGDLFFEMFTR
jgi:hypothetical protein